MPRIDANVILRYLTDEPPDQAEAVARLLGNASAGTVVLTVDEIVVAEVVWTLKSYYRMTRAEIVDVMLRFLASKGISCQDAEIVFRALVLLAEKNLDFADALLCARMLSDGDPQIYSFDHDFDRVPGIQRLAPG